MATTKRTAKKAPAKKAAAAAEQNGIRRGRSSDLGKYELFAEWAADEHGFSVDPEQAQFAILNYKHFQASDLNKEYNANKAAERGTATKSAAPAKKSAAKKSAAKKTTAAADSAPASKRVAAKKAPAKSAAAKRVAARKAAAKHTEEF